MQKLTVLGASCRALAQSALLAGFEPHAIDLFADRDLEDCCSTARISRYPQDFLAALATAPDGPWMYTGGLENYPALVGKLVLLRPLWGCGPAAVRGVRQPESIAKLARAAGCFFPGQPEAGQRAVVKPRRGSGGLEVRLAAGEERPTLPQGSYLQAYVEGEAASAVLVAARGRAVFLGATRQLLGSDFGLARPFLYAGSAGPLVLSESCVAALEQLGNLLAERFELVGLFNVDFVLADQKTWVMEVNPRYSASVEVLERASGTALVGLHAAACVSGELPQQRLAFADRLWGKAVVYADGDGVVPEELDVLHQQWSEDDGETAMADIPRVHDPLLAGQPVVTVFARGGMIEAVRRKLAERVTGVRRLLQNRA